MIWLIILFFCTFLYMEAVYHIACFGFAAVNPLIAVFIWLFLAGFASLLMGFFRRKKNRIILWILLAIDYLLFASQLVYIKIFKQPLLMAAIKNGGKDAMTNYWKEALVGILNVSGWLLLMAVPFVVTGLLLHMYTLSLKSHTKKERLRELTVMAAGALGFMAVLMVGSLADAEYEDAYAGFYDPQGVIEEFGVMPSITRDVFAGAFKKGDGLDTWVDLNNDYAETPEETGAGDETPETIPEGAGDVSGDDSSQEEVKKPDTSPHVLPVDFTALSDNADSDTVKKLADYMQSMTPTKRNEYTGMFEGYNLIFLTAEGFSPYAVDENLTPTLYKLIHSGFVFDDYYVPLWQTSTSDGEYVNLTGLIPDQQFSMKRSAEDDMCFSLASYFASEGVKSYAYHNNSLSYYDRYLSHPNLGYNFKACKLGDLDEKKYGGQVFTMEHSNYWPASDLDMMKATIPEYIQEDRFHVYYMTVSGHMNYNFTGNKMSSLHKEDVADLPYSEEEPTLPATWSWTWRCSI